MFEEFKKFAMRGPVVDLAIGVIIGAAFGRIVTSLVGDVIMPLVSLFTGGLDFSNRFVDLSGQGYESIEVAKAAGAPTLNYGIFVNTTLEFVIVAFVLFLIVKQMNRFKAPSAPPPPDETKECPFCLMAMHRKARRCPHCTAEVPT